MVEEGALERLGFVLGTLFVTTTIVVQFSDPLIKGIYNGVVFGVILPPVLFTGVVGGLGYYVLYG